LFPGALPQDAAKSAGVLASIAGGIVDIRSTPSGYTPKTQTNRTRDAAPAAPSRPGASPAGPVEEAPVDRVELSSAARELNQLLESGQAAEGLSAARIQQLAGRMNNGYYAQVGTIDRILKGALTELARDNSGA
jgi:hypothetical protein